MDKIHGIIQRGENGNKSFQKQQSIRERSSTWRAPQTASGRPNKIKNDIIEYNL